MNTSIYSWFLKPYPYIYSTANRLKISFGFGLIVFLFLYVFQPFNISSLSNNLLYYTLGFGLITTIVLLINFFILPVLFPKFFNPNKWIIGKFLLLALTIFIMISLCNWYYNLMVQRPQHTLDSSITYYLFVTAMVAIFPSLLFAYFIEKTSSNKHQHIAHTILDSKNNYTTATRTNKEVTIVADNQKDLFTCAVSNLIYVSSQGNYASVFYLAENQLKEHLIRTSLSKIETQLTNNTHIIRCHKSYLINTDHVTEINGNARGYLLKVNHIDFSIPVSRNFPKELLYTLVH